MVFSEEFFEKLKEKGIKAEKIFSIEFNQKVSEEVREFVQKVEQAKKEAGNSKLHFG